MRNLKKFLALVLAMLMVVSAGATVSAYSDVADEDAYAAAIAALTEWGIVNGTELGEAEDGSDALYEPDADVTRWQMALMMARTLAPEVEEEDWAEGMEIFGDVTEWYGAIAYAYVEGIINGVSTEELVFKPNDGIKYQDGLIMALRALGYEVDCSGVVYWLDAWTQAKQIGLTDGIAITSGAKTMTRAEMAQLIYNMINLPFADGSESLAIKYYGEEAPIGDATTFVITATPNQAYVKGQHTDATKADGETAATLVGLQELEAGIPAGDIIYFEAEALGIAADKANDYLHYAVNLYDYDAEYSTFSAVEIVADPVVVRGTAITESGSTIKVGGYTYFLVDSLTDAARRNEIVVFTGDADKKDSLVLIKNKDGDILNFDGKIVATYVYTLGSTNYYVDKDVNGNPVVISEAAALKEYGVKTADDAVFTEYETLSAVADSTPYQLSLFDDNGDDKYDRAIYNKVYMSVYNEVKDSEQKTLGPWPNSGDASKGITFTDTSVQSKGKIFTYTYNPQLKVVNVLEVLTKLTGTIENVNVKDKKVTIDGTTYTLASAATEEKMGADLKITSGKAYADIAKGAIDYTDLSTFYNIGSKYDFYAYNGYLLNGTKLTAVDEDANWKLFISDGAYAYDSTALYIDGYIANGEKTTIEISVIDKDTGLANLKKDTALADMNIFDLGEFLADAKDLFAKGNIFRVVAREDGTYRLLSTKISTRNGNVADLTNEAKFDMILAGDRVYEFDGGVSELVNTKASRIRTNDKTAFYFIKYDNTVGNILDLDIVYGADIDDGDKIINDANTFIYADVLGWGNAATEITYADGYKVKRANSGTSNVVLVYYNNDAVISGFELVEEKEFDIVYVAAAADDLTGVTIIPGSALNDTATPYYVKMSGTNAVNMHTGDTIETVYIAGKNYVSTADYYKMYDNNVIEVLSAAEKKALLLTGEVLAMDVDDYYVTLNIKNEGTEVVEIAGDTHEVTAIKHTKTTKGKIAVETNNGGDNDITARIDKGAGKYIVGDTATMLKASAELEDGKAVVVYTVNTDDTVVDPNAGSSTPSYSPVGEALGYWATDSVKADESVVYVSAADMAKVENYSFTISWNGAADTFVSADATNPIDNVVIAKNTASNVIYNAAAGIGTEEIVAKLSADKATLTLTLGTELLNGKYAPKTLDAGVYQMTIGINEASGVVGEKSIVIVFEIPAAN